MKNQKQNIEEVLISIGKIIEKVRKEKGLTQTELGELINVKKARLSCIENGKSDLCISSLATIFKALGIKSKLIIENTEIILS